MSTQDPIELEFQALFNQFNDRYFSGRLPSYRICVVDRITKKGESGWHYVRTKRIKIRFANHELMTETLLHEMAHAASNDFHGPLWKKVMRRLQELGALKSNSSDIEMLTVNNRLTRSMVEDVAFEALDADPKTTFHAIAKFLAHKNGYSIRAFNRRFPWIKKTFQRIKQEFKSKHSSPIHRTDRGRMNDALSTRGGVKKDGEED
jgi:hypothetical protein